MAGLIPQDFIDDLLDRADIVDVVGSRIALRKAGKNYSACCPFHDEKTPSFTVSPDKQFFYCFGCGAGGNSIGFLMDFDHIGFVNAVEDLAKRQGLDVPRTETPGDSRQRQNKPLYDLLEKASRFYRTQLRKHAKAPEAVEYLKTRGLTGQIANDYGVGYAPPGWDNLLEALGDAGGDHRLLIQSGLAIENPDNQTTYDRFRHRIMFPIRDVRGRVIGFGGRVLGDDKPKYLNSPETPVFSKGRELYGLFEANRALKELPYLLVVEGYMDVLALAQFGIRNAVATLGTAATEAHLDKAFRYTSEIVFCFDGDAAGRKAAHRAMENALPVMIDGRSVKFLFLPEGEDPDTLVRKQGNEAFLTEIAAAKPLSDFLFNTLAEGVDLKTLDGKARLSKLAAPMVNRLPEGVFKELMMDRLASQTQVDPQKLRQIILPPAPPEASTNASESHYSGDALPLDYPELHYGQADDYYPDAPDFDAEHDPGINQGFQRNKKGTSKLVQLSAEKLLIALLLNNPEFARRVTESEVLLEIAGDFNSSNSNNDNRAHENKDLQLFLQLLTLLKDNPDYTINHILGYWRGVYDQNQAEALARIAAIELLHPGIAAERNDLAEFENILASVKENSRKYLPAETLLAQLAAQDSVTEQQIKQANSAWRQLSADQKQAQGNALLSRILAKPRK